MDELKATAVNGTDIEESPRISPIENPRSIKLKLAYWFTKKKMGKVITPIKVVQARMPDTLSLSQKLLRIQGNLSLSKDLVFYIKSYVATLNGCSFCIDIAKAAAENDVEIQKYEELLNNESSDIFSEAEKTALQYVEAITLEKKVTDDLFEKLQRYYSDTEIVEITWLNAMENYYNLINKPLQIGSDNLCSI
jgi:alkylhydroperoxidase family enzyme